MKKKFFYLLVISIFVIMFVPISINKKGLFINNAYASKRCSNVDISDYCSDMAYYIFYYNNGNTSGNYCAFENTFISAGNNYLDGSCGRITSESDKRKCYAVGMCKEYNIYPYLDGSHYCETHDDGYTLTSAGDVRHEQDQMSETFSSLYDSVCSAAYYTRYSDQNYIYKSAVSGCMADLRKTGCYTDSSCKTELCKMPTHSDTDFCETNASSAHYLEDVRKSNPTGSTSGSGGNYTGGGNGGSIDEDKNIGDLNPENCYGFGEIVYYGTMVFKILQIVTPIILIIWASIDLVKSIIAGDEKRIVEMRKPIIQRFIAAILVYLVPFIVNTIVDNFGSDNDWLTCWNKNKFGYVEESKVYTLNIEDIDI